MHHQLFSQLCNQVHAGESAFFLGGDRGHSRQASDMCTRRKALKAAVLYMLLGAMYLAGTLSQCVSISSVDVGRASSACVVFSFLFSRRLAGIRA